MVKHKKLIFTLTILAVLGGAFIISPQTAKAQTIEELQEQIAALLKQIAMLQTKLAELQGRKTWCHDFNLNLRYGDAGSEVEALQAVLEKEGLYKGGEPSNFDERLASAVSGFQEKYKAEILAPWGLEHGTGIVGKTTRAKLNELYSCKAEKIPPLAVPTPTPSPTPIPTIPTVPTPSLTISDVSGIKNVYNPGEKISFTVKGIESDSTSPSYDEGFNVQSAIFDSNRTKTFDSVNGTYNSATGLWNVELTAPSDPSFTYDLRVSLYCSREPSVCATKYGSPAQKISTQIDTTFQFRLSTAQPVTPQPVTPQPVVCIQVITPAQEPKTGACKNFPTPCDVPSDWVRVQSCPIASITVLYPNGGERLEKGSSQTIKWDSANVSQVYIKLRKGNDTYPGPEGVVSNTIANTGFFQWTIPTTLPDGSDYAIRVIEAKTEVLDDSNSLFTIFSAAVPALTYSLSPDTPGSANVNQSAQNVPFLKFSLKADNVDNFNLRSIEIQRIGGSNYDFGTIKLFDESGTQISSGYFFDTAVSTRPADIATLSMYPYIKIPKGASKSFTVKADISPKANVGDVISFKVYNLGASPETSTNSSITGSADGNSMTIFSPCSNSIDSLCPSACSIDSDADCCTNAGRYWLKTAYGYGCFYSNYNQGCSAGQSCSNVKDACCPNWCYPNSDYDCCVQSGPGQCWTDNNCSLCTSAICKDSDAGKDYFTKGTCIDKYGSYTDSCYDSSVKEHFCSNEICEVYYYACPSYGCHDGICKKMINVISPVGEEKWQPGETRRISWKSSGIKSVKIALLNTMVPSGGSMIYITKEPVPGDAGYYDWTIPALSELPGRGGNTFQIRVEDAEDPKFFAFNDKYFSITSPITPSCKDSDGENYYLKGIVSGTLSSGESYTYVDSCSATGDYLQEYICDSATSQPKIQSYKCPSGCKDSSCISQTSTTYQDVSNSLAAISNTLAKLIEAIKEELLAR